MFSIVPSTRHGASMFRVSWFLGFRLWWFRSETWQAIVHEVKPLARLCVFARVRVLLILLDLACFPLIERLRSRPHHDAYTKHARARAHAHTHASSHTHTLYDVNDQGSGAAIYIAMQGGCNCPCPHASVYVCALVCRCTQLSV